MLGGIINALTANPLAPDFKLSIASKDITKSLSSRLISLSLADNRGFEVDQLDITLDDSDQVLELPPRGAVISLSLGWSGEPLIDKGDFTVDEISHSGTPDVLTIRARSADFRGNMNIRREKSYHETTLGEIIWGMAEANELAFKISPELAEIEIDHIDQTGESDGSFLTRLAQDYGAIATIKKGQLLFIQPGTGLTASGHSLEPFLLKRSDGDSHQFNIADRDAYTGVTANWMDTDTKDKSKATIKRKPRKQTTDDDSDLERDKDKEYLIGTDENVFVMRHTYASKSNAMRAAKAKWEQLQRGVATFSIQLARGRPELFPETPVIVSGFKKPIDEALWIIKAVSHSLSDGGFTTSLELEVKIEDIELE